MIIAMDTRGGVTPPHTKPFHPKGRDPRTHSPRYPRKGTPTTESKNLSHGVLLVLVGLGLAGVFLLLRPFIAPIVLAVFLVTIFHPLYTRLLRLFKQNRSLASAATVAGIFIVVVIPFFLFSAALVQQGIGVAERLQAWIDQGGPGKLIEHIESFDLESRPYLAPLSEFFNEDPVDGNLTDRLTALSRDLIQSLGNFILPLISQTGLLLMNFFIMFFIMFYAFRDGDKMLDYFLRILPLSSSHEKMLIRRVRYIARAVLLGMLLTAIIQAAVAMVGFMIIGIPALFWGVMLGISSFIPLVGTALVWVPVTLYMLISGKIGYAIFIFIWCAGGVGSIDNFLRPYLMQGKSGMSTLILFFALIGGIRLFGPIGILYGPMIFGLLAVMLYIYTLQHSRALDQLDRQ
ncbi:MAG: AI-2E family transporter [Spirochaetaceae bacterium]